MADAGAIGRNTLGIQVAAKLSAAISVTADNPSVKYIATATTQQTALIPSFPKNRVVNKGS